MKSEEQEVMQMSKYEVSALIEAIKIIVEETQDVGKIQNALSRIQDALNVEKPS